MPDGHPNNRTTTAAAVLALIIVIVVAGALFKLGPFADDSGSSDTSRNGDFLASADRICNNAHGDFGSQQQSQPKTASEAAQMTKNLLEVAQGELDQIQELTPPPNLKSKVARYLSAREQGVALLQRGVRAAEGDDFGAYESLQAKLAAGQRQRQRLAQAIGLEECSQPSLGGKELAQQARSPGNTSLDRPNEVNNPPPGTP